MKYTLLDIESMRVIIRAKVGMEYYKYFTTIDDTVDDLEISLGNDVINGHTITYYRPTTRRDKVQLDMLIETKLQSYINAGITWDEMEEDWSHDSSNPSNHDVY